LDSTWRPPGKDLEVCTKNIVMNIKILYFGKILKFCIQNNNLHTGGHQDITWRLLEANPGGWQGTDIEVKP
jgi:hypothetical protein